MKRILLTMALCLAAWCSAPADVVLLNTGNRMEGQIVAQDAKSITLRVNNAEVEIPRDTIKQIIEQQTPRELYQNMLDTLGEDDAKGHYEIALYCIKEKMPDEAVELLRRAVQLKPDFAEAAAKLKEVTLPAARDSYERGQRFIRDGQWGKARECFTKVVDRFPENARA